MADAVGFSVQAAAVRPSFEEVLAELPEQALAQVNWTPEELAKLVTTRLAAWT
jgi:hypothetical protein